MGVPRPRRPRSAQGSAGGERRGPGTGEPTEPGFARLSAHASAVAAYAGLECELRIARQIQAGFLPAELPVPPGWEIEVEFRPARQVAGDFYDVFDLPASRRTALIVADVCDKGVGAAMYMALIRTLLRHTAETGGLHGIGSLDWDPLGGPPAVGETPLLHAVNSTNRYLTRVHGGQGYFATVFFGVLDAETGLLTYVNGGQNPPLHVAADGRLRATLEPNGPAVGVLRDARYHVGRVRLEPGDCLVVYTDGVTECRARSGEFFGEDRLLELATTPFTRAGEHVRQITRALERHADGNAQSDDITLLVLRRSGDAPARGSERWGNPI